MYQKELRKILWRVRVGLNLLLPRFLKEGYQSLFFKHLEIFTELKNKTVLIVGLGKGMEVPFFLKKGCKKVIGVDPYPIIEKKLFGNGFELVQTFGEKLPFKSNYFDIVYSVATLEHVKNPLEVVKEMARVLKPNGIFYCQAGPLWNTYNGYHPKDEYRELNNDWFHLLHSKKKVLDKIDVRYRDSFYLYLTRIYCSDNYNRLPASIYYKACCWLLERFTPLELIFNLATDKLSKFRVQKPAACKKLLRKYETRELVTSGLICVFIK